MSSAFDQLNLRPFERRLVAGVGTALFLVLNFVFVWPHFGDRKQAQEDLEGLRRKLERFQREIAQMPQIQARLRALEGAGEPVPEEDQGTEFLGAIQRQASQSGVTITGTSRMNTRTNNQFFIERNQTITVLAEERQLLDFLYRLGAGNSMTRIRGLSLRPDAPRNRLSGNITLVASYQKKQPPARGPAAQPAAVATKGGKAAPPASKPAAVQPGSPARPQPSPSPPPAPAQTPSPPDKSTSKRP